MLPGAGQIPTQESLLCDGRSSSKLFRGPGIQPKDRRLLQGSWSGEGRLCGPADGNPKKCLIKKFQITVTGGKANCQVESQNFDFTKGFGVGDVFSANISTFLMFYFLSNELLDFNY